MPVRGGGQRARERGRTRAVPSNPFPRVTFSSRPLAVAAIPAGAMLRSWGLPFGTAVSALVPGAEDSDHHPDIEIHYKQVVLSYSTHSEGGVTEQDIDGAAMADAVAATLPHLEEFGDG